MNSYTFLSYVNYQINCFTLVAGPIQRYKRFPEFLGHAGDGSRAPPRRTFSPGTAWCWARSKWALLAPAIQAGYQLISDRAGLAPGNLQPLQKLAAQFYGYPLYLYFNFSGYTDIAVAAAQLLGLKCSPENFNHPFTWPATSSTSGTAGT